MHQHCLYLVFILGFVVHVKSIPVRENGDQRIVGDNLIETDVSEALDLSYLDQKMYGKPETSTGEKLKSWSETSEVNPEEVGEYLEGDILFPSNLRNGLIAQSSHWDGGIVPFEIVGSFTSSDIQMIQNAMAQYHKLTCIRFKRRMPDDRDYLSITNAHTGCWSSVGKIGGRQEVNLQSPGCLTKIGTPMHELMHAIGFTHEQNRWERDDHVSIVWRNIQSGKDVNFKKATKESTFGYGVPYDYTSVMHYSDKAFSQNGQSTIIPKVEGVKMGQREGFSRGDIQKLNKMYNCPDSPAEVPDQNNNNIDTAPSTTGGGILSLIFG